MCLKLPCSFLSGIWRRVCVSPLMWARVEMIASVSRAELRSVDIANVWSDMKWCLWKVC